MVKFTFTHRKIMYSINIQSVQSIFEGNVWKISLISIIKSNMIKRFLIYKTMHSITRRWNKLFTQNEFAAIFCNTALISVSKNSKLVFVAPKYHLVEFVKLRIIGHLEEVQTIMRTAGCLNICSLYTMEAISERWNYYKVSW